jgi:hypothetical protein
MFCILAPERVASVLVEQPQLPTQEAFTPVSPTFAVNIPLAAGGIHREAVRMPGDQLAELPAGELEKGIYDDRGGHMIALKDILIS